MATASSSSRRERGDRRAARERFWAAVQARDWVAAREQLAENVVIDWPATGERFSGRDRYLEVQRIYPEGWSIEVRAIAHEGAQVAAEVRVPHGSDVFFCAAFYELEDGVIARVWSTGRRALRAVRRVGARISRSRSRTGSSERRLLSSYLLDIHSGYRGKEVVRT